MEVITLVVIGTSLVVIILVTVRLFMRMQIEQVEKPNEDKSAVEDRGYENLVENENTYFVNTDSLAALKIGFWFGIGFIFALSFISFVLFLIFGSVISFLFTDLMQGL